MALQEQIAQALGFTLNELASNRLGRLSVDQSWRCTQMALAAAGFLIAIVGLLLATRYVVRPSGGVRVIFIVYGLAAFVVATFLFWRTSRAAFAKRVISQTGVLSFERSGKGLAIKVGATGFNVPRAGETVLTRGDVYRVYYLAHTETFLSIEKLDAQPQ
jgi:hypothetical protein